MKSEERNILLLVGIPASGKSTLSKHYIIENPNYIRVNRDDIRKMLKDSTFLGTKGEDLVTKIEYNIVENALAKGFDIIWDNTHVKLKYINDIIDKFSEFANISFKKFDIDINTAIERDSKRELPVGKDVIKRMYDSYINLCNEFNFNDIKKVDNPFPVSIPTNNNLENCVIFDIDGTLAFKGNRVYFDWNKVDVDYYNPRVGELVNYYYNSGYKIIILSGRDSSSREKTIEWLNQYNIPYHFLYMRQENDYRKDNIIKKEIYYNHIKDKYNVHCVYDDRLQVIDMWYKEGVYCFNVNQGNKIF